VYEVVTNGDNNVYAAGFFTSGNNGPVLIASMLTRGSGSSQAFIAKLDSNGSGLWLIDG
jgi:hypothetical protein